MVFKSWTIAAVSFFSGVLIDLDHIPDYIWEYKMRFRVNEFFNVHHNETITFAMIAFHSWELLVMLNIYAFFISGNPWIIGIATGFTQHVFLDQIFNKSKKLSYFFFWRLKNGFKVKNIFQID